ncbi:MAG: sigma-54-dependent Fis family transcriptional regulator, partial [Verrucomicrobiae bacterium]|nr:sigma-54-dependent Fis family transcriptional regulator [Verrucomicrobiae bacterium]
PPAPPEKFPEILGQSPAIQQIFSALQKTAATDSTVLITGESGTGKELVARALHNLSPRQKMPFIAIHCGALPEQLLESEMFGHKRGSFTGAFSDKKGLFEEAEGGSVFLDEIGTMPMSLQAKILRFLQDKELRRVGDNATHRVNVRVIAASNENLEEKTKLGAFREDLFYRLSVIALELPPLRDRPTDVPALVTHFLKQFSKGLGIEPPEMLPETMRFLQSYRWPGNVRELQNAIERAVTFSNRKQLTPDDLPARVRRRDAEAQPGLAIRPLKDVVREFEQEYCAKALKLAHGDRRVASHMLRISLPSFYRKLPPGAGETNR